MRLAILSDVHGNLPALEAVLERIGAIDPDEIWCLGDVVGYGAEPDACARIVAERCAVSLLGNHDLAVIGGLEVATFSPAAAAAVEWTRANASKQTLEYLRGLEPADESREVALYHASPRDPVWEYVLWPEQAAECIALQARRVSLVGHSHVALHFRLADGSSPDAATGRDENEGGVGALGAQVGDGAELDLNRDRWLINPGSVGQPRDGDPRAAWLELDTGDWSATYHRVPYAIDRAAEAIARAELPVHLAERLYLGH